MTTTPKSPTQIESELEFAEVNADLAPDCRRILQAERVALQGAIRSGDASRIAIAKAEAIRVAAMWGVTL